ncbi:MAG: AAA family ATPase, partial [Deltaproteobacteria bacterium]|nr:AAA family ATPase [Deltaproteobacteria bacterium]
MNLLTISELTDATGLEESLIRFYESEYGGQLPEKILRGNGLFFQSQAVAVFQNLHARHGGGPAREAEPEDGPDYARVIAVSSGKGGVGKSNLALNLAIEMQRFGRMSLVLDADLGMANIHLLAGIQPRNSLTDLIKAQLPISDLISEGPAGVGIITGGSGVLALADSTAAQRRQMLAALEIMEKNAQVIIVDTAAGMGAGVRDFLRAADEIILVLTQDLTSLADAYGLLKALRQEGCAKPVYSVINMAASLRQA